MCVDQSMADRKGNRFLHDVKQPIAAIMNFASAGSRMAGNNADHDALKKVFGQIQTQAERLSELCRQHDQAETGRPEEHN